MSTTGVDDRKRRFLTLTGVAVGAVGVVGAVRPFLASMAPSERAKALGAPVTVDISKLEEGQLLITTWRGSPVWIVRRTPEMLDNLDKVVGELRDPNSVEDMQPAYAQNDTRALRPEVLVMVGRCTHLGCSPSFRPDYPSEDLGKDWLGGFFCPCHGSKFDMAGRVYKGVPAPLNMPIPPYRFADDNTIVVGEDTEVA
ncbi:MAG: ubiquinol-cytochrome c reductase iron-sulfur subunit [Oceanococcaceae bacterium]